MTLYSCHCQFFSCCCLLCGQRHLQISFIFHVPQSEVKENGRENRQMTDDTLLEESGRQDTDWNFGQTLLLYFFFFFSCFFVGFFCFNLAIPPAKKERSWRPNSGEKSTDDRRFLFFFAFALLLQICNSCLCLCSLVNSDSQSVNWWVDLEERKREGTTKKFSVQSSNRGKDFILLVVFFIFSGAEIVLNSI